LRSCLSAIWLRQVFEVAEPQRRAERLGERVDLALERGDHAADVDRPIQLAGRAARPRLLRIEPLPDFDRADAIDVQVLEDGAEPAVARCLDVLRAAQPRDEGVLHQIFGDVTVAREVVRDPPQPARARLQIRRGISRGRRQLVELGRCLLCSSRRALGREGLDGAGWHPIARPVSRPARLIRRVEAGHARPVCGQTGERVHNRVLTLTSLERAMSNDGANLREANALNAAKEVNGHAH
jgi:hypothetical protein